MRKPVTIAQSVAKAAKRVSIGVANASLMPSTYDSASFEYRSTALQEMQASSSKPFAVDSGLLCPKTLCSFAIVCLLAVANAGAMAADREIRLRKPSNEDVHGFMNEFFDPFLAREVYKTADDLDGLYRFVEGVPDQALTAYKQWRQTIEEDPEAALEVVFGHPERVHLQRLYDVGTIYDIWRSKYRHFPEWRMSFDQWHSRNR